MWLTIVELDLLCRHEYKLQRDQHVSSSNTLHQDLVKCGSAVKVSAILARATITLEMKTCWNKYQRANRIELSVKCRSLELKHHIPKFREDVIVY